jgi:hypothetical protein
VSSPLDKKLGEYLVSRGRITAQELQVFELEVGFHQGQRAGSPLADLIVAEGRLPLAEVDQALLALGATPPVKLRPPSVGPARVDDPLESSMAFEGDGPARSKPIEQAPAAEVGRLDQLVGEFLIRVGLTRAVDLPALYALGLRLGLRRQDSVLLEAAVQGKLMTAAEADGLVRSLRAQEAGRANQAKLQAAERASAKGAQDLKQRALARGGGAPAPQPAARQDMTATDVGDMISRRMAAGEVDTILGMTGERAAQDPDALIREVLQRHASQPQPAAQEVGESTGLIELALQRGAPPQRAQPADSMLTQPLPGVLPLPADAMTTQPMPGPPIAIPGQSGEDSMLTQPLPMGPMPGAQVSMAGPLVPAGEDSMATQPLPMGPMPGPHASGVMSAFPGPPGASGVGPPAPAGEDSMATQPLPMGPMPGPHASGVMSAFPGPPGASGVGPLAPAGEDSMATQPLPMGPMPGPHASGVMSAFPGPPGAGGVGVGDVTLRQPPGALTPGLDVTLRQPPGALGPDVDATVRQPFQPDAFDVGGVTRNMEPGATPDRGTLRFSGALPLPPAPEGEEASERTLEMDGPPLPLPPAE